jgi:beta-glucosidase
MCFGRAIALEKAEKYFDAIIYAWHSGTKAAQSIAKILFGEVNPSGKLPMTFPRTTAQVPIYYNYYPCGRNADFYYKEETELWRAYRDLKNTPMYPFGYGLSYSEFEYTDISCNIERLTLEELKLGKKFEISVSVKNIGKYDGKETTQCYIQDLSASVGRPIRELKTFSKNYIAQNEQIDICFEIGYKELGFYNEQGDFVVEPGDFDIYIGGDSYAENKITINVN